MPFFFIKQSPTSLKKWSEFGNSLQFEEREFWVEPKVNSSIELETGEQETFQSISDEKRMLKIWHDNLLEDVSLSDDFFDIGGDSLTAISIISDINKEFNVSIGINDINNYRTPKEVLEKFIRNNGEANNIGIIQQNSKVTNSVFFIHPAGGSTYCYSQMAKHISIDANAYSISFPYETMKESFSIETLAKVYSDEVIKLHPHGDIVLAGYSFGGNVAVEMASILEEKNRNVKQVFLFDSLPPESYLEKMEDPDKLFSIVSRHMFHSGDKSLKHVNNSNINLSIKEQIEEKRQTGEISSSLSDNTIALMFKNWKQSHDSLVHQKLDKVNVSLTSYVAKDKMEEKMYKLCHITPYKRNAWEKYTNGSFDSIIVEGDHYSIFTSQDNLKRLSNDFSEKINKILS